MLNNVDLDEIQALRSDIQSLFYDFLNIGRQAMENSEKKNNYKS